MCPVIPEILLTAKDQKQGKKKNHLNFIGWLLHLVNDTAQTPAVNDAQPCLHRAKSRAPWEPNSPWGFGRLYWEKVAISSQLLIFKHYLHKLCFEVCPYFFEVRSLFFPPVFLFMRLFAAAGWTWQWKCWTTGVDSALLLTQTWEPALIRFCCCIPDFISVPKKKSDNYLNQTSLGRTIPSTKTLGGPIHAWARARWGAVDSMPTALKAIPTYRTSAQSDWVNYRVNCLGIHIYIQ